MCRKSLAFQDRSTCIAAGGASYLGAHSSGLPTRLRPLLVRLGSLVALCLACGTTLAVDDEDEAEFDGFSRAAESAVMDLLEATHRVSTYSEKGTIEFVTGMPFGQPKQQRSFIYARPNRFRMESDNHELVSDGRELTIYRKDIRRFTVEKLKEDFETHVRGYVADYGVQFSPAQLFISRKPRTLIAEQFRDLDVTGRETIEGEECVVLAGKMRIETDSEDDQPLPITLYLSRSDKLLVRMEVDLLESMRKQMEDAGGGFFPFSEYRIVYTATERKINEDIPDDRFRFEAPSSAKKVDRFFGGADVQGETAGQFALSGKEAPDFELDSADGRTVTMADLRGNVVVLHFPLSGMQRRFRRFLGATETLGEIAREYTDKGVRFVCVYPGDDGEAAQEELGDEAEHMTVALDAERRVAAEYFEGGFAFGLVLVSKDGLVQGRYTGSMSKQQNEWLRKDLDKLLAGETLAAGTPMTEEQLHEAMVQSSGGTFGPSAEPVNEELLTETWTVFAAERSAGMAIFGGGGGGAKRGLWVRNRDAVQQISPEGKVLSELPIPHPSYEQFAQDSYVIGRRGSGYVLVYLTTIPGEEQYMGWRAPKGAKITASDEEGEELWKLELEVENQQIPQHLTLADVDGRAGDELLFTHQNALWVVDGQGEVLARRPVASFVQWLNVEDLDGDRRAEVYIRTQQTLERVDVRGGR